MIKESGHWYDKEGEARHTIMSAKGEPRPTTLRDAKKFGWYPSVTDAGSKAPVLCESPFQGQRHPIPAGRHPSGGRRAWGSTQTAKTE